MFKLFVANLKMTFRNRQSLFWVLAFPLIFTVIFGFFFGSNVSTGTVDLINNSKSDLAQNLEKSMKDVTAFKTNTGMNESEARVALNKSQISAIVIIPEGFGDPTPNTPKSITIIEDPATSQTASVITGYINQYLTQIDFQIYKIQPTYSLKTEKTNNRPLNYFDFVLMGLIGMALMNSSIQGVSIAMSNYREDKILKRITTTPLPTWKFIFAEVISRLVLNVIQISLILSVGYYGFHAHIYGNIFVLFAFSLLGGLLFQCFGFMVAALTKTTDAAEGMATAIAIPMMFLAGVFFPIDSLPKWLYSIVQYLPLAPLLKMIRSIGSASASPFADPKNIVLVGLWIVIVLSITIWRFRLADE